MKIFETLEKKLNEKRLKIKEEKKIEIFFLNGVLRNISECS